jgi:hypothetical protein
VTVFVNPERPSLGETRGSRKEAESAPFRRQVSENPTNPANLCPICLWWRGWRSMPREIILNNEDADCKRFLSDLTIKPGELDWTGPQGSLR